MFSYCRLCLETDRILSDVSEQQDGKTIAELISFMFNINIELNDQHSKKICEECLEILVTAYQLRQSSRANQNHLPSQWEAEPTSIKMEQEEIIEIEPESIAGQPKSEKEENIIKFATSPRHEQEIQKAAEEDLIVDTLGRREILFKGYKNSEPACSKKEKLIVETSHKREVPTRTKNGQKRYQKKSELACSKCGKVFEHRAKVFAHINTVHNDIKRPHKCRSCSNQFSKAKELQDHAKIHVMDKLASKIFEEAKKDVKRRCSACSESFYKLKLLKKHWDFYHDSTINPFSCAYCYVRGKTEKSITDHVVKIHRELSTDRSVVLIKDHDKLDPNTVGVGYVVRRMAIFVNPKDTAKNSELEKRYIKVALRRIERLKKV